MKTFTMGVSKSQVLEMIPENVIHRVKVDDRIIALVRIGEDLYSFQSDCPHRGASLIEGSLNAEGEIICPLHSYRFDIKTGHLKAGSCGDLDTYTTELTDEGLKICFP